MLTAPLWRSQLIGTKTLRPPPLPTLRSPLVRLACYRVSHQCVIVCVCSRNSSLAPRPPRPSRARRGERSASRETAFSRLPLKFASVSAFAAHIFINSCWKRCQQIWTASKSNSSVVCVGLYSIWPILLETSGSRFFFVIFPFEIVVLACSMELQLEFWPGIKKKENKTITIK